MLTSQRPSLDGDGQQLTAQMMGEKEGEGERCVLVTILVCKKGCLTRERDVALVLASITPLEHGERLTDWECPRGILECDDLFLVWGEFDDAGVLFELEVGPKVARKRREGDLDVRIGRVGYLEVHVTFELHGFDAAFAQERDRGRFLDDDVHTESTSRLSDQPKKKTCLSGMTDGRLPLASFCV